MTAEKRYLKSIAFNKTFEELCSEIKDKKVLIYGAGLLFETAVLNYDIKKLNIVGVSDKKFEAEDSPQTCCGIKTFKPDELTNLDFDCILVAVKEYNSLVKIMKQNHNIPVYPLFKKPPVSPFEKRNIRHNIYVERFGLHGKKPRKFTTFEETLLKFRYKLGKFDIPQIEFNLTTKCTLRCKHCSNFIPQLNSDEHCPILIDDFKKQLSNLLRGVSEVKNLILLGGELLLIKNLYEFVEYAASQKKVKRLWIVTNGTLLMNEELQQTCKKYREKLTIWVSNYSKNPELESRLRHQELLEQIHNLELDYDYVKDLTWGYTSPLPQTKMRENSKLYFAECSNHCVAVFGGKIYICPRAGVFHLKKIYTPQASEIVDLTQKVSGRVMRKKLIEFYSQDDFSACNYCTILEDKMKDRILPAQQL